PVTAYVDLASTFAQRTCQMSGLVPARFARMADVLTTVTAKSGAPTMATVNFAQQIAPAAQQAGIGQAGVLGMSAAFAKLGDDGYVATNAVNKMMTDLSRSVHEGTDEMNAYANAVGMTSANFKALFQSNPVAAV